MESPTPPPKPDTNPFMGLTPHEARVCALDLLADFVASWCEFRPTTEAEFQLLRTHRRITADAWDRCRDYVDEIRKLAHEAGHPYRVVPDPFTPTTMWPE